MKTMRAWVLDAPVVQRLSNFVNYRCPSLSPDTY